MNQQERNELLNWTRKQGRILTCNGQATTFYTRERGFPFETDELPHHHLIANNTDAVFANWARNEKTNNPICGVYSRPIFVGGFEHTTDHDELVYNVQTHSLFIDLRIPRLGMTLFQNVKGLESMRYDDLKLFARRHVFAGYTRIVHGEKDERPICTRHHCMDWNFVGIPRPRPNKWYVEMSPCGNVWKELAFAKDNFDQHYYWERWERLERDGNGKGLVLALRRDRAVINSDKERDGVIVIVGDHFNYMYGRTLMGNETTYAQSSLVDLVDAAIDAGDRSTAESYLSIDAGHGRISTGWKIDCAIQPWKHNTRLFDVGCVVIHGSDIGSCRVLMDGVPYKVYESSVGMKELETLFHSTDRDPPSIDAMESILFGGSKNAKKRNYETAMNHDHEKE